MTTIPEKDRFLAFYDLDKTADGQGGLSSAEVFSFNAWARVEESLAPLELDGQRLELNRPLRLWIASQWFSQVSIGQRIHDGDRRYTVAGYRNLVGGEMQILANEDG